MPWMLGYESIMSVRDQKYDKRCLVKMPRTALKLLAIAKGWSRIRAVVTCIAALVGGAAMMEGAAQTTADTKVEHTSGAPVIRAKPEQVTVTKGTGSTEIQWDTGNGSAGFVFVTAKDRQPSLFASGAKGSLVAPWIRPGKYTFELCGDNERRALLAIVIVTGTTESGASAQAMALRSGIRWLLILILFAIVYFAVYLSSTATLRTTFPTEAKTSPYPLHVARNLLLGVTAFVCLDGIIFHSGLYVSILAPNSYAGRLAVTTQAEKQRPASGLKEVLVVGDSRLAEGFSTTVANELGSSAGLKFVNLAEPALSFNAWYYMLREVDPTTERYWAIVIPYGVGYEPSTADPLRISMAGPLLRYTDCFNFASAFQRWSGRFRAFTTCIFRGSGYQSDVSDLLEHPIERIKSVRQKSTRLHSREAYKGRDWNVAGMSYDPKTGQVTFPPTLTERQRQVIRNTLLQPSEAEVEDFLALQRNWIPKIVNRYSNSTTTIVLTAVPRSSFRGLTGLFGGYHVAIPSVATKHPLISLPQQTFDFLEKPEYYFDALHLNAKGRQKFTDTLVSELLGRLRSADWKTQDNSGSQVAVNAPRAPDEAN